MAARTAARSVEELVRRMAPVAAPPDQQGQVVALFRLLDRARRGSRRKGCQLMGPSGETVPIPNSVFYVFERVAEVLARGDAITVIPVGKELTTQQAADLLNVSRQYLVRLLDQGRIPSTKTGKHRRLKIEDVLAFKEERYHERKAGIDDLARLSEELGGYEELSNLERR